MENLEDTPLPLRGPSLPGSLGVRVRGDWESFGEEHEGINMRSNVGDDANVQLDFMKEESNDLDLRRNRESFGVTKGVNVRSGNGENSNIQLEGDILDSRERDLDETGRKLPLFIQTTRMIQPDSTNNLTECEVPLSEIESKVCDTSGQIADGRCDLTEHQVPINETQDVQPICSLNYDSFGTNSLFRCTTGSSDPVRPLPDGKKYHVFFSYDMEDRDWVHSVVEKMESEHGYRCSFHERDFHGGKRVIENIDEHIQWSVKTVLVLSPDFLESSWCQFEMKQGLHASIEEARMLIVPVLVRECEVPDTLRSLTYIDATPGTDWWSRFLEAIAAKDHLQICNADKNQMCIQPRFDA